MNYEERKKRMTKKQLKAEEEGFKRFEKDFVNQLYDSLEDNGIDIGDMREEDIKLINKKHNKKKKIKRNNFS